MNKEDIDSSVEYAIPSRNDYGKMVPLKFFDKHRIVKVADVETVLRGSHAFTKKEAGWTKLAKKKGLFIDLSKVEYVDFTALAKIALLVEGAARHKINVVVALPFTKPRTSESAFIEHCLSSGNVAMLRASRAVEERIISRKRVQDFMLHTSFISVLEIPHVDNQVYIDYDYDSSIYGEMDDFTDSESLQHAGQHKIMNDDEYFLKKIFPFRWVKPDDQSNLLSDKQFLSNVIRMKNNLGLEAADADSIARIILAELVVNVYDHASEVEYGIICRPYALVGGIALDPDKNIAGISNIHEEAASFISLGMQSGSPVIRLIIGDSGRGIIASLSSRFDEDAKKELPDFNPPLRREEDVIFWSLNEWSTSRPKSSPFKLGTRGLWLVRQLVASYCGVMLVRSEDVLVGYGYDSQGEKAIRGDKTKPPITPGTLLDVYILTKIPKKVPAVTQYNSQGKQTADNLTSVYQWQCVPNGTQLLSDNDLASVWEEFRTINKPLIPRRVIGILDSITQSSRAAHEVIESALQTSAVLNDASAFIIIWTGITDKEIEIAVKSSNSSLKRKQSESSSTTQALWPILLINRYGHGCWVGGKPEYRETLYSLTQGVENSRANNSNAISSQVFHDNLRNIPGSYHFLNKDDERGIIARFFVDEVNIELIRKCEAILQDSVKSGHSPGVQLAPDKSVFRTPTLQYVSRWINCQILLEGTIGLPAASYALARKIERILGRRITNDEVVVRINTASSEIASRLAACLNGAEHIYALPGELDTGELPEVRRVPNGSKVILCTDLVLSSNTIIRGIAQLANWNVEVLAVTCVLDARCEKTVTVLLYGKEIPLVSLASIDIATNSFISGHCINIDPILMTPDFIGGEVESIEHDLLTEDYINKVLDTTGSEYDIRPTRILEWCASPHDGQESSALCFGHIERTVGRHFTAYVNAVELIKEDTAHGQEILGYFEKHITDWLSKRTFDEKGNQIPVLIWCPGPKSDISYTLANTVQKWIESKRSNIKFHGSPVAIPRAACYGRWVFPTEIEAFERPAHVIILDWGALTAVTVQQLMRLASISGAASVRAIVLLSQLEPGDESVLRKVKRINAVRWAIGRNERFPEQTSFALTRTRLPDVEIESSVSFISALQIGYYTPRTCPVCNMRLGLESGEENCPTDLLHKYVVKKGEMLREVDRDEAFRGPQHDLYGQSISGIDIQKVIRLKQALHIALNKTQARNLIKKSLDALHKSSLAEQIAWIRLLATETNWLKLPPLCFANLRTEIADLAFGIATNQGNLVDYKIRLQAITVLRNASKESFIAKLPELFEHGISDNNILVQILYDIFSFIQKPYHRSTVILSQLLDSLRRCKDFLSSISTTGLTYLDIEKTLDSLIRLSELFEVEASIGELDGPQLWHRLLERYKDDIVCHATSAPQRMIDIILILNDPTPGLPPYEELNSAVNAWKTCERFLSVHAVPYIRKLNDILLEYYAEELVESDQLYLRQLIGQNDMYRLGRLSEYLSRFITDPLNWNDNKLRNECRTEANWWYQLFLNPGDNFSSPRVEPAELIQWLDRCPANLLESIQNAEESLKNQYRFNCTYTPNNLDVMVFCDKPLLESSILHIIQNANEPKHKARNAVGITEVKLQCIDINEKEVSIEIKNTNSAPTDKLGKGIITVDDYVKMYQK